MNQRIIGSVATSIGLAVALPGCASDLGEGSDGAVMVEVDEIGGPQVGHVDEGDGIVLTSVDATSESTWVYLSLVDGAQLEVEDPLGDPSWDLAFQRFHIKLDGGASGMAGVEVAILLDEDFDALQRAPADGYVVDAADGDDEDDIPDYALRGWYDYDVATHILTPRPEIYVLRTGDGRHYKLEIDTYYDDAGTSAHPRVRWGAVDAP